MFAKLEFENEDDTHYSIVILDENQTEYDEEVLVVVTDDEGHGFHMNEIDLRTVVSFLSTALANYEEQ